MELIPEILGHETERSVFRRPDFVPSIMPDGKSLLIHRIWRQRYIEAYGPRALHPALFGCGFFLLIRCLLDPAQIRPEGIASSRFPLLLAVLRIARMQSTQYRHSFPIRTLDRPPSSGPSQPLGRYRCLVRFFGDRGGHVEDSESRPSHETACPPMSSSNPRLVIMQVQCESMYLPTRITHQSSAATMESFFDRKCRDSKGGGNRLR